MDNLSMVLFQLVLAILMAALPAIGGMGLAPSAAAAAASALLPLPGHPCAQQ
jgi:hypothetical protein